MIKFVLFLMCVAVLLPAVNAEVPVKVCVLDFTTIDIAGQKRFLDENNREIVIPAQDTLNDKDRKSINGIMQGFVRMIDAWDNTRTNQANRLTQTADNQREWEKALNLYRTVVKGESRPVVIGAEYLSAYLGKHSDAFNCISQDQVGVVMSKLQGEPDFPKDFMLKIARETGATHLIYGTVSDLRIKSNEFKGYGIQTKTTNFQLDVIIKVVDLIRQHTVYNNVYTGNYREQRPVSAAQIDHNIFQTLMTSALEQAAEDLYEAAKPGPQNKISPAVMPTQTPTLPSGGAKNKK